MRKEIYFIGDITKTVGNFFRKTICIFHNNTAVDHRGRGDERHEGSPFDARDPPATARQSRRAWGRCRPEPAAPTGGGLTAKQHVPSEAPLGLPRLSMPNKTSG